MYWICNEELNTDKVRDHCHTTGKFRGAAHTQCNLKLKIPKKLPIFFHNLEGYDEHIIFKELNKFDVTIEKSLKQLKSTWVLLLIKIFLLFTEMNSIKAH